MVTSRQREIVGQFSDDSDYRAAFYRDVLRLISSGHKKLIKSDADYSNEEEPNITGEIVRCTNEYIDSSLSSDSDSLYSITEDPPENTGGRLGKSRKKSDIICMRTGRKPRTYIKFEAKRLKKPGFPASKYVGDAGMGEFISGNYAPESGIVGMLGYVQSDDNDYWAEQISDEIDKKKAKVHLVKGGRWQKANIKTINDCYTTKHNRPSLKREILVYHLLLKFKKGA